MVRLVVLEFAFENTGALQHVLVVFQREILELQVVANVPGGHERNTAVSLTGTVDVYRETPL